MINIPNLKERTAYNCVDDALKGLEAYVSDHKIGTRDEKIKRLYSSYVQEIETLENRYNSDIDKCCVKYARVIDASINHKFTGYLNRNMHSNELDDDDDDEDNCSENESNAILFNDIMKVRDDIKRYSERTEDIRILFENRLHVIQACFSHKKQMLSTAYQMKFQNLYQ